MSVVYCTYIYYTVHMYVVYCTYSYCRVHMSVLYVISYVDDLTTLKVINLLSIGLSSCNFKQHIPSDIPAWGFYIDPSNLQSQHYLNEINKWTKNHKMLLNNSKTKAMIINFTHKHQFTTRLQLDNKSIEVVDSMKNAWNNCDQWFKLEHEY